MRLQEQFDALPQLCIVLAFPLQHTGPGSGVRLNGKQKNGLLGWGSTAMEEAS